MGELHLVQSPVHCFTYLAARHCEGGLLPVIETALDGTAKPNTNGMLLAVDAVAVAG